MSQNYGNTSRNHIVGLIKAQTDYSAQHMQHLPLFEQQLPEMKVKSFTFVILMK